MRLGLGLGSTSSLTLTVISSLTLTLARRPNPNLGTARTARSRSTSPSSTGRAKLGSKPPSCRRTLPPLPSGHAAAGGGVRCDVASPPAASRAPTIHPKTLGGGVCSSTSSSDGRSSSAAAPSAAPPAAPSAAPPATPLPLRPLPSAPPATAWASAAADATAVGSSSTKRGSKCTGRQPAVSAAAVHRPGLGFSSGSMSPSGNSAPKSAACELSSALLCASSSSQLGSATRSRATASTSSPQRICAGGGSTSYWLSSRKPRYSYERPPTSRRVGCSSVTLLAVLAVLAVLALRAAGGSMTWKARQGAPAESGTAASAGYGGSSSTLSEWSHSSTSSCS